MPPKVIRLNEVPPPPVGQSLPTIYQERNLNQSLLDSERHLLRLLDAAHLKNEDLGTTVAQLRWSDPSLRPIFIRLAIPRPFYADFFEQYRKKWDIKNPKTYLLNFEKAYLAANPELSKRDLLQKLYDLEAILEEEPSTTIRGFLPQSLEELRILEENSQASLEPPEVTDAREVTSENFRARVVEILNQATTTPLAQIRKVATATDNVFYSQLEQLYKEGKIRETDRNAIGETVYTTVLDRLIRLLPPKAILVLLRTFLQQTEFGLPTFVRYYLQIPRIQRVSQIYLGYIQPPRKPPPTISIAKLRKGSNSPVPNEAARRVLGEVDFQFKQKVEELFQKFSEESVFNQQSVLQLAEETDVQLQTQLQELLEQGEISQNEYSQIAFQDLSYKKSLETLWKTQSTRSTLDFLWPADGAGLSFPEYIQLFRRKAEIEKTSQTSDRLSVAQWAKNPLPDPPSVQEVKEVEQSERDERPVPPPNPAGAAALQATEDAFKQKVSTLLQAKDGVNLNQILQAATEADQEQTEYSPIYAKALNKTVLQKLSPRTTLDLLQDYVQQTEFHFPQYAWLYTRHPRTKVLIQMYTDVRDQIQPEIASESYFSLLRRLRAPQPAAFQEKRPIEDVKRDYAAYLQKVDGDREKVLEKNAPAIPYEEKEFELLITIPEDFIKRKGYDPEPIQQLKIDWLRQFPQTRNLYEARKQERLEERLNQIIIAILKNIDADSKTKLTQAELEEFISQNLTQLKWPQSRREREAERKKNQEDTEKEERKKQAKLVSEILDGLPTASTKRESGEEELVYKKFFAFVKRFLSQRLLQIAPDIADYGIFKEDELIWETAYLNDLFETILAQSKTNRDILEHMADILLYADNFSQRYGEGIFRDRIRYRYYLPQTLVKLDFKSKLPELYDVQGTLKPELEETVETKEGTSSKIDLIRAYIDEKKEEFVQEVARLYLQNSTQRVQTGSKVFDPIVDDFGSEVDLLETCEELPEGYFERRLEELNQVYPPQEAVEKLDKEIAAYNRSLQDETFQYIYYPENGKRYCLKISTIAAQLRAKETPQNPFTGNELDADFIEDFKATYSLKELDEEKTNPEEEEENTPPEVETELIPGFYHYFVNLVQTSERDYRDKTRNCLNISLDPTKEYFTLKANPPLSPLSDTDGLSTKSEEVATGEEGGESEVENVSEVDKEDNVSEVASSVSSSSSDSSHSSASSSAYSTEVADHACSECGKSIGALQLRTKVKLGNEFVTREFCSFRCFNKNEEEE